MTNNFNPYKILNITPDAAISDIDNAYKNSSCSGLFFTSWKILRDEKYRHLYDKYQDIDLLVRAGFFEDKLEPNESDDFALDFLATPVGKILNNLKNNNKKNIVLVSTGGFAPLHDGHINNMELAKNYLENNNFNVVGGYFSPCHEDYVKTKPYYNSNLYKRLYDCELAVDSSSWLMVDPWECLYNRTYTNFTLTIKRLQKYLDKHLPQKVEVAYVFGADNAEFMYCFEDEGYGICINRDGHNKIFEQTKNKLQSSRCIFIENKTKEAGLSSRNFRLQDNNNQTKATTYSNNVYAIRNEGLLSLNLYKNLCEEKILVNQQKVFLEKLCNLFNWAFDNKNKIKTFDTYTQLNDAEQFLKDKNTISIDNFYVGTYSVGMSRLFEIGDLQTKSTRLVERPGLESIENQIEKIKPGKYILVDDDIATGTTINTLKQKLPKDVIITDTYLLAKIYNDDFFDIVDLRDFIVGSSQSGLVVRLPNNQTARAPYLFPYVNLKTRACIPFDKCIKFSLDVWKLNKEFYSLVKGIKLCNTDYSFQKLMNYIGFTGNTPIMQIIDWHIEKLSKLLKNIEKLTPKTYKNDKKQQIIDFLIDVAVNEFGFTDWLDYLKNKDFEPYKTDDSVFYFIEQNNKIIATCAALKKDDNTIKLNSFYVKKDFRNQGLGTLLYNQTIDFAKQKNYKTIILCAHKENVDAIKFYEQRNFIIDRIEDNGEIWYKLDL